MFVIGRQMKKLVAFKEASIMKMRYSIISLVLILAVCSLSQAATKVLEWKFDGDLTDSSGNGTNGTAYAYTGAAALSYTTGVSGQAILSDGNQCAYTTTANTSIIPLLASDTWTVNVWVYPTVSPAGNWKILWNLGAKPNGDTPADSRALYATAAGNICFNDGTSLNYLSPGVPFDVGQWQMITTTYDGTKIRIYKNGNLIGSKAFTFVDALGQIRVPSSAWWGYNFIAGKYDEFTIWRGVMSQQEIVDMLIPGVVPEPNLVEEKLYYKMDDGYDTTMPDHSGSGNNGLLYGFTGSLSDWIVSGQKGGALLFNGNQDIEEMPITISQNLQYTAAMWLKSGAQNYASAFYCEKSDLYDPVDNKGSSFIIQAKDKNLYVYSTDQYYQKIYDISYDASEYLNGTAWNHIAVVADGDMGKTKLYINGDMVADANYLRADSKVQMSPCIGYNINGNGFIAGAQIDEVRLYKGLLPETDIKVLASKGNLNDDMVINFGDVDVMADDWLVENTATSANTLIVGNMEGSIAGWAAYPNTNPDYTGNSKVSLTTNAYTGTGGLQWDYNLPGTSGMNNYTSIVYDFGQATDLSSYDALKLSMYRHLENESENLLFIKFINGSGTVKAEIWDTSGTVNEPNETWKVWQTSLDALLGEGGSGSKTSADLTDVRYLMIGCGSWNINTARKGIIDIDDVMIIRNIACAEKLEGDINMDCIINFKDFAILAEDWMLGVE
jgi:hypothetical protein